jgi:DMSO/TMAO reductase YedYZ molybdopterin-dependent catalytic subunit
MTDQRPGEPERGPETPAEIAANEPAPAAQPSPSRAAGAEPTPLPAATAPPASESAAARASAPEPQAGHEAAPEGEAAQAAPNATKPAARVRRAGLADFVRERPEVPIEIPRARLSAGTRRDFLLFSAGVLASAAGAWWLLPDRTRGRLAGASSKRLDSLAARLGLTRDRAEGVLDRALTFDDDVAEALYSRDRRVRTYDRSQVTPLRNNYDGQTPGPEYLPGWRLRLSGLASGSVQSLSIGDLESRLPVHEQVTRLVCVEGWSAVAWWGGLRFADLLEAYPPAPGTRWAALRSSVNLDGAGRPDPYYVSIDLETALHPQSLLATRLGGRALPLEHGAPMRLLAPMKLGLKNIKAVTNIAYTAAEPPDYWNERGYSKYDGL